MLSYDDDEASEQTKLALEAEQSDAVCRRAAIAKVASWYGDAAEALRARARTASIKESKEKMDKKGAKG